jgi:hypothetical protein
MRAVINQDLDNHRDATDAIGPADGAFEPNPATIDEDNKDYAADRWADDGGNLWITCSNLPQR